MKSIKPLILKTYKAAVELRRATDRQVKTALQLLADELEAQSGLLLAANARDLGRQDKDNPRNDRLLLNEQRIRAIAKSIRKVSRLPDPSGKLLEKRTLPNGLKVEKRSVPLGVVGAIYESRPNVTFDIAALCLRSRNACLLKGSQEASDTNKAAITLIKKALKASGIHPDCVTLLPAERETVQELFTATRWIDVLIPRGSESLIRYVRANSLVPVIETGAGVCHVYVEREADLGMAANIVVNAKVSRPSVCNAMDTLLVDAAVAPALLRRVKGMLAEHEVEIFQEGRASGVPEEHPLCRTLGRAIESVTGKAPEFEMCPGLLETRFYAKHGIPGLAFGPGLLSVSHGPNEFVPVKNIGNCAAVYALVAQAALASGDSIL